MLTNKKYDKDIEQLIEIATEVCKAWRMAPRETIPVGPDNDYAVRTQYMNGIIDSLNQALILKGGT